MPQTLLSPKPYILYIASTVSSLTVAPPWFMALILSWMKSTGISRIKK
jgi:hypothetical protein